MAWTVPDSARRQSCRSRKGCCARWLPRSTGRRAFEVSTAVGTAAARSTDWFVEASPNAMQVGVLSGSVAMTSGATRRAVVIPPRWGARLETGRDPVSPRVWSQAEFDAVTARTDVK